jgi:hypothetical protein
VDEEDAVEDAVSPYRLRVEREADGSCSDEEERSMSQNSERSVSEGDVSVAESEESDISEHDQEEKDAPLTSRIQSSLSSLGSFLPNLLRSPAKGSVTSSEPATEEEEDIVDHAITNGHGAAEPTVKAEPEDEDDANAELHFGTDSDDEEGGSSEQDASEDEAQFEAEASEELDAEVEHAVEVVEEPSGSDEESAHTPSESDHSQDDIQEAHVVKTEPVEYTENTTKVESTPVQPRRLVCVLYRTYLNKH